MDLRPISELAAYQYGPVAWRQLRTLGLSPGRIQTLLSNCYLCPIHHGVYGVGHTALTQKGRWMAAVLACGEGAVLSHRAAAAHWNLLPMVASAEVTRRRSGRHRIDGIRIHRPRRIHPTEVTVHERIPVTTVARTLVDLSGLMDVRQLERAFAAAERQGLLRWPELRRAAERGRYRRGHQRLLDVMDRADPSVIYTASEAERLLHAICAADPEIPQPAMNVNIGGRIVDFVWLEQRLIAETDGRGYHSDPFTFEDDRDRDGVMLEAGFRTVRFTYRKLSEQPDQVANRIKTLLGMPPDPPTPGRTRARGATVKGVSPGLARR